MKAHWMIEWEPSETGVGRDPILIGFTIQRRKGSWRHCETVVRLRYVGSYRRVYHPKAKFRFNGKREHPTPEAAFGCASQMHAHRYCCTDDAPQGWTPWHIYAAEVLRLESLYWHEMRDNEGAHFRDYPKAVGSSGPTIEDRYENP